MWNLYRKSISGFTIELHQIQNELLEESHFASIKSKEKGLRFDNNVNRCSCLKSLAYGMLNGEIKMKGGLQCEHLQSCI